jgi:HNH endonuclease
MNRPAGFGEDPFIRIMRRTERQGDCLVFTGRCSPKGYGRVSRTDGGSQFAHRIVWEHHNGPVPAGRQVCHRCDNPPCVEIGCLFLGTPADNSADMVAKGRSPRLVGERSGKARLAAADVAVIRRRRGEGEKLVVIAMAFGIDASHAGRIVAGTRWPLAKEPAG